MATAIQPAYTPAVRHLDTEREVAKRLSVSIRTLQAWRISGKGPRFVKMGFAVRYDRADVDRYIDECTRTNTAA